MLLEPLPVVPLSSLVAEVRPEEVCPALVLPLELAFDVVASPDEVVPEVGFIDRLVIPEDVEDSTEVRAVEGVLDSSLVRDVSLDAVVGALELSLELRPSLDAEVTEEGAVDRLVISEVEPLPSESQSESDVASSEISLERLHEGSVEAPLDPSELSELFELSELPELSELFELRSLDRDDVPGEDGGLSDELLSPPPCEERIWSVSEMSRWY